MTTSPYDSLPSGNNDITPESAPTYVDVELPREQAPIIDMEPLTSKTAPKHSVTPKPAKPTKSIPLSPPPQYISTNLKNMQGCFEYILPFEESLLVPDTMPDMQKVLFAEGRAEIAQPDKLRYETNDFLAGDITAYTVYRPVPVSHSPAAGPATHNDSPVDVVKSIIPFKTDKCWNNAKGSTFRVKIDVKSISAEMVNERKFIIKGELIIKMIGITEHDLNLLKNSADNDLITLSTTLNTVTLNHETAETLDISQEISVESDLPMPIKILKASNNVLETHRQIASGKLVINGSIHSDIFYLGETENGEKKISCMRSKTDFTQFIHIGDRSTSDLIRLSFNSRNLSISIDNKDKFLLQGSITTLVQSYQNKELTAICDAYHKSKDLYFEPSAIFVNSVKDTINGEISSREVIDISESESKPSALLCGTCFISSLEGRAEKNNVDIFGSALIKILALDSQNVPFVIDHTMPIKGFLNINAEDMTICTDASLKEFSFSEINSRQIEINLCISVSVWSIQEKSFCTIKDLCFTDTGNPPKRIPMAIYAVDKGDSLWNIAKRYKTDVSTLVKLNDLDPQAPLLEGAKLLITK